MNVPDPLLIGGQPVVVGRIVHSITVDFTGARRSCAPMLVLGSTDAGALRLRDFARGDVHDHVFPAETPEGEGWHWPDANSRQCQGRA